MKKTNDDYGIPKIIFESQINETSKIKYEFYLLPEDLGSVAEVWLDFIQQIKKIEKETGKGYYTV